MISHKYFDCSNNDISNKTHNVDSLGPYENDIMKDLDIYSNIFGFQRVDDYKEADIIITNTIYPTEILKWSKKHNIPRIKRMDGIYWMDGLLHKNKILNKAAKQSDHVIFISEYSKNTLKELYNLELNSTVILNNADDGIFYPKHKDVFRAVTSCTNWDRDGKRLDELIELANNIDDEIHIIGKCDKVLPDNMVKHGYIDNQYQMSKIIGHSNIFISLFFRDAGSKVTCQAIKCGLPVLYTSSGGLKELVNGNGIEVTDYEYMDFRSDTPALDMDLVISKYEELKQDYYNIVKTFKIRESYYRTMKNYYKVMSNYL